MDYVDDIVTVHELRNAELDAVIYEQDEHLKGEFAKKLTSFWTGDSDKRD